MIKVEKGCQLGSCALRHMGCECCQYNGSRYLVCDECETEDEDELYDYDGSQICIDCLKKKFKAIRLEDM